MSIDAHVAHSIDVDGVPVAYTVRTSNRVKYARLEVNSNYGLLVIVPRGSPDSCVTGLIFEQKKWVLKKLCEYERIKQDFAHNEKEGMITYLGKKLMIIRYPADGVGEKAVSETGNLSLYLRQETLTDIAVERWLRLQAKNLIVSKVQHLSLLLGVSYNKLNITSARTRWGSCSSRANLSFSWKLIRTPEEIIDYVVVHELCHIIELNHSKRFWQLVEQLCPEWKTRRKWLRKHQLEIMYG
jgi:predicted metal-dependent hydrolase